LCYTNIFLEGSTIWNSAATFPWRCFRSDSWTFIPDYKLLFMFWSPHFCIHKPDFYTYEWLTNISWLKYYR